MSQARAVAVPGEAGVEQVAREPGITDLRVGQPDPDVLLHAEYARAVAAVLEQRGASALAYGANAGSVPARSAIAGWTGRSEGFDCDGDEVLVTAGASHALDFLCTRLGGNGSVVLVQRATYNLALDLFRSRGLIPEPVGSDLAAPTADELYSGVKRAHEAGRRIAFLYIVPTFHNPTSWTIPEAGRLSLIEAARNAGILIVEDDPYRLLYFDAPPPPSLFALSGGQGVIGVRSLSKVLGPGLRLGYLLGAPALLSEFGHDPLFASGGGISHIPSLALARILDSYPFDSYLDDVRCGYSERKSALLETLHPGHDMFDIHPPAGGFFIWMTLAAGGDAPHVLRAMRNRRVRAMEGARCFAEPGDEGGRYVRFAFSMHSAAVLAAAGERIVAALLDVYNR